MRRSPALDEAAIRDFLSNEYPGLVGALFLVCGDRAMAEDAVQEALARAWERSEHGERIESLRAWVTKVALNVMRSGFRRLGAERRARARLESATEPPLPDPSAAAIDVRRALAALPRRQREATVLRYYLDMDLGEISSVLGVTEGATKTTLFRARRALASSLGESDDAEAEERV